MRKLVICFIILFLLLLGCSSGNEVSEFTIKVSGTKGLQFEGVIIKDSTGEPFEGVVPAEIKFTASGVNCFFNKKSREGTLKVEIIKDGVMLKESETSLPNGIIAIGSEQDS